MTLKQREFLIKNGDQNHVFTMLEIEIDKVLTNSY